ncbi:SDR family oxidoreductase [Pedobacter montanisoli]|uniref:SDR family oxidoreductase n=1 Tax=Pedobacter montanisoli TaxID=2923277 RepID=A0ABS9ZZF2_9SPHI|nr:SDR family oxidoreductase [Pedobacter montanisoli]MCJ0743695.1 SDR family oxidoreductase [Pedobacter montanisoli]
MENLFSTVKLAQKRALITGGTSGIGLATALLLVKYGIRLYIIGRDEEKLEKALEKLKGEHEEAEVYGMCADVADPEDLSRLFESIDKNWGGLDILINNAGLGYGSILNGHYQDWEYIVKTNLLGYIACCHEAVLHMTKQGSGHIICIGSMSADTREEESSLYVATKSALQGFSESFRKEVNGQNIHVTLIEPGSVATPMHKIAEAEKQHQLEELTMLHSNDIARSILYVLSQSERCAIVDLKIKPLKQLI